MRRKDWKIKNLEKNSFGRLRRRRQIFFLRKLSLRKYKTLVKLNLYPNFIFFSNFLINLKKNKTKHLDYIFSKSNSNLIFLPDFTFFKKINNKFIIFKKLQKKLNFKYRTNLKTNDKNYFGFNLSIIKIFDEKVFDDFLIDENNKNILSKKYFEMEIEQKNDFNFFFIFNIQLFSCLEIYKILIILNLNNLNK